jgi:hypothetical protein
MGLPQDLTFEFEAYPNPFSSVLTVSWHPGLQVGHWQIMDLTGRLIHSIEASEKSPQKFSGIHTLKSGVYFLQAIGKNGKQVGDRRLIKW